MINEVGRSVFVHILLFFFQIERMIVCKSIVQFFVFVINKGNLLLDALFFVLIHRFGYIKLNRLNDIEKYEKYLLIVAYSNKNVRKKQYQNTVVLVTRSRCNHADAINSKNSINIETFSKYSLILKFIICL
jgi:hypothetical protein